VAILSSSSRKNVPFVETAMTATVTIAMLIFVTP
jgi:hypothetical protein